MPRRQIDPFATEKPRLRSVSQLQQYEKCPHAWFLQRVQRAWQRPAAWLPQGSAVHATIEWWERGGRTASLEDAQAVFAQEYAKEVWSYSRETPNFEWWFPSGPYKAQEDLPRRFRIGIEQVAKYIRWATGHPEEVVWFTPDGEPAIELHFDIEIDGALVQGYIDLIVEVDGVLRVRDHKTGNSPGDDFQLGVYSVAVDETFGVKPEVGDYWMGKPGKPTHPFDLSDWTKNEVSRRFLELEENIQAERFDPDPDPDKCRFCSVSFACKYSM